MDRDAVAALAATFQRGSRDEQQAQALFGVLAGYLSEDDVQQQLVADASPEWRAALQRAAVGSVADGSEDDEVVTEMAAADAS